LYIAYQGGSVALTAAGYTQKELKNHNFLRVVIFTGHKDITCSSEFSLPATVVSISDFVVAILCF